MLFFFLNIKGDSDLPTRVVIILEKKKKLLQGEVEFSQITDDVIMKKRISFLLLMQSCLQIFIGLLQISSSKNVPLKQFLGQWPAIFSWQFDGHVALKVDKNVPPPRFTQVVVTVFTGFQHFVLGQCVIDPPEPSGDPVGDDNVDGIVASSQEQTANAEDGKHQG